MGKYKFSPLPLEGRLAAITALQLELSLVPLYEGQALYDEVIALVAGLGFELYAVRSVFVDEQTGRSLQVDGMFVRSSALSGADK